MGALWEQLDAGLARRGFAPTVRDVLLRTASCGVLGVALGVFQTPFPGGLFWFGLASLLSAWNFYGLAKFIHQKISSGWKQNLAIRLFFGSQLRLCLTGVFVYVAFVRWQAPLAALFSGLSSVLLFILISVCCPSKGHP